MDRGGIVRRCRWRREMRSLWGDRWFIVHWVPYESGIKNPGTQGRLSTHYGVLRGSSSAIEVITERAEKVSEREKERERDPDCVFALSLS